VDRVRNIWLWIFFGAMLVATTQVAFCLQHGRSALSLLNTGNEAPARPWIERELGHLPPGQQLGHDGKYFYLVARHPRFWTATPEFLEALQDPGYRYGRPLYPLLAGIGGYLTPLGTLWGLIFWQVTAGAAYGAATSQLVKQLGLRVLSIPLIMLNPALFSSAALLTSDLPALAFALWGVVFCLSGQHRGAIIMFSFAILCKEYYLLIPLMVAFTRCYNREYPKAIRYAFGPVTPWLIWKIALLCHFGRDDGASNFRLDAMGFRNAADQWDSSGWLLALLVFCEIGVLVVSIPFRRGFWVFLSSPWIALAILTSEKVWNDPADLLRATAPLWVFMCLALGERATSNPK
jgi:hypothetical protein